MEMESNQRGITSQNPDSPTYHLNIDDTDSRQDEFKLETLLPGGEMYDQIEMDFQDAGLQIEMIERLDNSHLKKKYQRECSELLDRTSDSNFKLNERFLYHGTTAKKMYICEEGLDSRVSKRGCFGKGIYFSDYPRKCIKYAEKGGSTESIILLMRVILGDSKVYAKGQKDKELVREPEKEHPYTGFRYYDSVQGCPVNHREFVVYENRRALVECIITYRKPQLQVSPQSQPLSAPTSDSLLDTFSPSDNTYVDSDTSSDEEDSPRGNNDDRDTSSDSDDDTNQAGCPGDRVQAERDPINDHLEQLEKEFSRKTQIKDKHLIQTYLLMADLDINKAIKLSQEANFPSGITQDEYMAKMSKELNAIKTNPIHNMDGERFYAMSSADQEKVMQCLIDDFLEVIGKEKQEEEDRILAKRYLQSVKMNLDHAIISYYEELAGDL